MSEIMGKMFLDLLVSASFYLHTICPILFRQQEDALTFGEIPYPPHILENQMLKPLPALQVPNGILAYMHILGASMCLSFSPWKRFLTPTLQVYDLWFCLPLASVSPLPGGRAGSMTQLRAMIQNVVVRDISEESLCLQFLRWVQSMTPSAWNNGAGLSTRISESWHWMGLGDTCSGLILWMSSYLISKGVSTLYLRILRKRHMIISLSDYPFSVCSLFYKENSFHFGILLHKVDKGSCWFCLSQWGYWDVLVRSVLLFLVPSRPWPFWESHLHHYILRHAGSQQAP